MIRQSFCAHVVVLPEAASVVFGGGFPRHDDDRCRQAAERALYHVQRELEAAGSSHNPAIVLCDRGTLDGLAFWMGEPNDTWAAVSGDRLAELARYEAVIDLCTPTAALGYNHQNPLRTDSAEGAAALDDRILEHAGSPARVPLPRKGNTEESRFAVDNTANQNTIGGARPGAAVAALLRSADSSWSRSGSSCSCC